MSSSPLSTAKLPFGRPFDLKAAAVVLAVIAAPIGTMIGLGAAQAASQTVSGEVTDVFGRKFVLATPGGDLLITAPYARPGIAKGQAYRVTGERDGREMTAQRIEPANAAPAHAASIDAVFPPQLRGLDLALTGGRDTPYGIREIFARLPDGTRIEADIERRGHVSEIRAVDENAALPRLLVDRFVPRNPGATLLAGLARIHEIDVADNGTVSVDGFASDGRRLSTRIDAPAAK